MTDTTIVKLNNRIWELEKENEQLKSENEDMRTSINNISHQRDEFHHGVRENANHVRKLKKENKQLKQAIAKDTIPRLLNGFEKSYKDLEEENEQLKSYTGEMEDYLARLEEKSEQLKQILNELSDMLQFDVENGIRSYPVKLSEYLSNVLKELQKND